MSEQVKKRSPRLLERLQSLSPTYPVPLYYVTLFTQVRSELLSNKLVHDSFTAYARVSVQDNDAAIGAYLLMPDHLHFSSSPGSI